MFIRRRMHCEINLALDLLRNLVVVLIVEIAVLPGGVEGFETFAGGGNLGFALGFEGAGDGDVPG